jgi:hypothetical protein
LDGTSVENPDEQLKKVLQFRRRMHEQKELYWKRFHTIADWEPQIRQGLTSIIVDTITQRPQKIEKFQPKAKSEKIGKVERPSEASGSTYFGYQARDVLKQVLRSLADPKRFSAIKEPKLDRFQLISAALRRSTIGVHELNRFYLHRRKLKFGNTERVTLIATGLAGQIDQNTPYWYWLAQFDKKSIPRVLEFFAFHHNPAMAPGALQIASRLKIDIAIAHERASLLKHLLNGPDEVRLAAIDYVKALKVPSDVSLLEDEIRKNHPATRFVAEAARFDLIYARNPPLALKEMIDGRIGTPSLLRLENANVSGLTVSELERALGGQSPDLTIAAMRELLARNELKEAAAEALTKADSEIVRREALRSLIKLGRQFEVSSLREIVNSDRSKGGALGGLFGFGIKPAKPITDLIGELASRMSDEELRAKESFDSGLGTASYLELRRREGSVGLVRIRADISNRFHSLSRQGDPSSSMPVLREVAERELTSGALEILARANDAEDLDTIRKWAALVNPDIHPSIIDYLTTYGLAGDAQLLIELAKNTRGITLFESYPFEEKIGQGVYKLFGGLHSILSASLDLSESLFLCILRCARDDEFASLGKIEMQKLLDNANEQIRQICTIKIMRTKTRQQGAKLLDAYLKERPNTYFYNVVFWMDVGSYVPDQWRALMLQAEL